MSHSDCLRSLTSFYDLRYYYFVESDLGAVSEEDREVIGIRHRESAEMTKVFAKGPVTIYQFAGGTTTNSGQVVAGR